MANLPMGFAMTAAGAVLLVAGLQNKSVRAVILNEPSNPSTGSTAAASGSSSSSAPGSPVSAGAVSSTIPNVTSTLTGSPGAKAAQNALTYLNVPYVWGGLSRLGIDCSGLVEAAYESVGVSLPHNAAQQWLYVKQHGTQLSLETAMQTAGALIFLEPEATGPGHVAISLGNGNAVEAPHTGDKVKVISINDLTHYDGFVGAGSPLP